jgi:hypothetical protein
MKKLQKRLSLNVETLRNLSEVDSKLVAGGFPSQYCSDGTSSCCTVTCGTACTKFNC